MDQSKPGIDVILFDLGGVLVELQGPADMLAWFPGVTTMDEVWRRWLTSPAVRKFESGGSTVEEFAPAIVAEMRLTVTPADFLASFVRWPRGPYPGARELLWALTPKYRLACLANANPVHWERVEREMGILEYFQVVMVSHRMGMLKPDREVFLHAIHKLDSSPARILFLDDNQLNVDAARAVGIRAERTQGLAEAEAALRKAGVTW